MSTSLLTEKLKTMRLSRGMTQADVAERAGVSRSTYSYWESGRNIPTLENVEALADAFNVPISTFWETPEMVNATRNATKADYEMLEQFHQNPRLGLLFDRAKNLTDSDIGLIMMLTDRMLEERRRMNGE